MHKLERKNGQKRQRALRLLGKYWPYYLMMLPGLVYFALLKYAPMYGVLIAFKDFKIKKGIWGSPWVGLQNFRTFFTSTYCSRLIGNTLIISFTKLVLSSFMSVFFALLLNECTKRRFKRLVQTVSYMPHFLSWVIIYGIVYLFCSESAGYINRIVRMLTGSAIPIMTSNTYFRGLLYFTELWKNTGYASIIYMSVIVGIDPGLYEAATIDGASRWQRIVHITLPAIRSTFIMLTIMNIGKIMNAGFDQIYVFYSPQVYQTGDIIDTYVYRAGLEEMRYGLSTAVGLFKNVIGFTLVFTTNRIAQKWGEGLW
ncbi:MAG: ABC transporter permease [Candidatus Ventricola sp.]